MPKNKLTFDTVVGADFVYRPALFLRLVSLQRKLSQEKARRGNSIPPARQFLERNKREPQTGNAARENERSRTRNQRQHGCAQLFTGY